MESDVANPIFQMSFASVYPHYVAKAEKVGEAKAQLDEIIAWLTGYNSNGLAHVLDDERDFETFIANAPKMNSRRALIKGVVCGVRVEDIADPFTQEIRHLDKLVDELARGEKFQSILRT